MNSPDPQIPHNCFTYSQVGVRETEEFTVLSVIVTTDLGRRRVALSNFSGFKNWFFCFEVTRQWNNNLLIHLCNGQSTNGCSQNRDGDTCNSDTLQSVQSERAEALGSYSSHMGHFTLVSDPACGRALLWVPWPVISGPSISRLARDELRRRTPAPTRARFGGEERSYIDFANRLWKYGEYLRWAFTVCWKGTYQLSYELRWGKIN